MSPWVKQALASHLVAVIMLTMADLATAQSSLADARALYSAAAYDDALLLLNVLRTADHRPEDGRAIDQYRALCLLALGRTADATTAIEGIVAAAPAYHPSESDVSPSVRAAFRDVRRLMLPAIIQQKYTEAKAEFDRKNMTAASEGFKLVVELFADSDLGSAGSQPPLSQLRPLAISFRDLTAASTLAPAPPLPASPSPRLPATSTPAGSRRPAAPRVYGWEDTNVTRPIVVRQTMPVLGDVFVQRQGIVDIVIDEAGLVETVTMKLPVNVVYDGLVMAAVRTWRYRPATLDGVAVKFRKTIQLDLKRR